MIEAVASLHVVPPVGRATSRLNFLEVPDRGPLCMFFCFAASWVGHVVEAKLHATRGVLPEWSVMLPAAVALLAVGKIRR